jgi:hypothetical protein
MVGNPIFEEQSWESPDYHLKNCAYYCISLGVFNDRTIKFIFHITLHELVSTWYISISPNPTLGLAGIFMAFQTQILF